MNELPVILSYFAQSEDQKHLYMLDQEADTIQLAWEPLENANTVQFVQRRSGLSTPEQIGRDIKTHGERIVLFHFSGHAGHDELLLNDGAGGPDGIAGLLNAYAKNLKVVVLNGCSTRGQVETFFRRGVRVVVATQCAVKDAHAMLFATTFHRILAGGDTIQIAYRDAILAVKGRKELAQLLPQLVAEKAIDIRGLDTSPETSTIWGLFTQDTGSAIVEDSQWLAIRYQAGRKPKINPEKAYIFERDQAPYSDIFNEYFDPLRNPNRSRIQQYLLAGARTESPLGLIRKFFYESVMQSLDRRFYYYSFSDLFDGGKVVNLTRSDITPEHILRKMLLAVTGPIPAYANVGLQTAVDLCKEFFEQNYFKQREYVLIAFRVPPNALTDITTRAISDTITRLNEWAGQLAPGRLSFLFFWAIEQERSFLDILSSSPLKKLISRFDTLRVGPLPPRLWVINRDGKFLKTPRHDDIENWLNDHYLPATSTSLADDMKKNLYRQSNVETLENDLLDLIEKVNMQTT